MRDDPWTAANRNKEEQKEPKSTQRKKTPATASSPSKPAVSGPFWTGREIRRDVP
jgi:hypothetical protein